MDPLTVVTTALSLGAIAGAKSTAEQVMKDAYSAFKSLLLRKFGQKSDTASAVEGVEAKPGSEARRSVLKEELSSVGADRDQEVVDRATELLRLLESQRPGVTAGLVGQINAAGGKVVVFGGSNHGTIKM
jgi:hypothetical protein